jgi:YggT family protein
VEFLSFFVRGVAKVLDVVLYMYMVIIFVRAILSWVSPDPYNPIVRFLYSLTEPVLYRVRRALPMPGLGIDLSPIIVLLAIFFLQEFLVNSLYLLAQKLG